MNDKYQLYAYLSTLVALVVVFTGALIAGAISDGVISHLEAFGLGTTIGGLIGILRMPQNPKGVSDQTATALVDKIPPTPKDPE